MFQSFSSTTTDAAKHSSVSALFSQSNIIFLMHAAKYQHLSYVALCTKIAILLEVGESNRRPFFLLRKRHKHKDLRRKPYTIWRYFSEPAGFSKLALLTSDSCRSCHSTTAGLIANCLLVSQRMLLLVKCKQF